MNVPREQHWIRVEQLAEELNKLPPEQAAFRLSQLNSGGESPTVLTLLGAWLELPPLASGLEPETVIADRYVLKEHLGEGGMGTVWRAEQKLIARDVALKIIHPALATPALTRQFTSEMKVLGLLNHPGIVRIFDAGLHHAQDGGSIPFYAMELIQGERLDRWAAAHRNEPATLLRLACSLCTALAAAHEREIVHRDLKPSNILVRHDNQPVIVDFGIARLRGIVFGQEDGTFSGTPLYAAPEQHLGRDHDFRSGESVDVYALGAIIFEMFAGRRLFEFPPGASLAQIRHAVVGGTADRLASILPNCEACIDEVVAKAVRREPSDRFYSMAAFSRALQRCLKEFTRGDTAAAPWSPAAGLIVPGTRWKLFSKIGAGGAGEVWIARHEQLDEKRVFKFCDTEEKARTLKRELTLFRLLKERVGRNPHFVPLHEVSLDEPPWYLMMDLIEARDLATWLKSMPGGVSSVPETLRLEIVAQTAEALQAAHDAGILHRDIKPGNLLIREVSAGVHVFVADFGIGQLSTDELLRGETRLGFTRTVSELRGGPLSGSLLYLAPELLEGNPATVRSDIYSLGVVLWQLLTGNLSAALDPTDWPTQIPDPLLRDILLRCLAGVPARRWASAGELAAALRALPEKRAAEERRLAEQSAREEAAYRRGVWRTAVISGAIIAIVLSLALIAWVQRKEALRARGAIALEQALTLPQSDLAAGRKHRGLRLLESAVSTVRDKPALRSAAALVHGIGDLAPAPAAKVTPPPTFNLPAQPGEVARVVSPNGRLAAIARSTNDLAGLLDLYSVQPLGRIKTISRETFPWLPIAEAGLLKFTSDASLLAVAGPATSQHLLILNSTNGALLAYTFHASAIRSLEWHPEGRLIAAGHDDGSVNLYDLRSARTNAPLRTGDFDLPPALDIPVIDSPAYTLPRQRASVDRLTFAPHGRWLALQDNAGYLRVYTDFMASHGASGQSGAREIAGNASLVAELRLANPEAITSLSAGDDSISVIRSSGLVETYRIQPGDLPSELYLSTPLRDLSWNRDGSQFCAATMTDAQWFRATPFALVAAAPGVNPSGSAWNPAGSWLVAGGNQVATFALHPGSTTQFVPVRGQTIPLPDPKNEQAALTAITSTRDGRAAVYHGRSVQILVDGAPAGSPLVTRSEGTFRAIFWDAPGRLLSAVFASTGKTNLQFETWQTSSGRSPNPKALPLRTLRYQRITPANDGVHVLGRDKTRGVFRYDPSTEKEFPVDASASAAQDFAIAASADGSFLAMVVDRTTIRLLRLPSGEHYADLQQPRPAPIAGLWWSPSGEHLATFTADGRLQLWALTQWREWLAARNLKN